MVIDLRLPILVLKRWSANHRWSVAIFQVVPSHYTDTPPFVCNKFYKISKAGKQFFEFVFE